MVLFIAADDSTGTHFTAHSVLPQTSGTKTQIWGVNPSKRTACDALLPFVMTRLKVPCGRGHLSFRLTQDPQQEDAGSDIVCQVWKYLDDYTIYVILLVYQNTFKLQFCSGPVPKAQIIWSSRPSRRKCLGDTLIWYVEPRFSEAQMWSDSWPWLNMLSNRTSITCKNRTNPWETPGDHRTSQNNDSPPEAGNHPLSSRTESSAVRMMLKSPNSPGTALTGQIELRLNSD